MSDFVFIPNARPFPRWMGPYCPARGTRSGFRVRDGRLGTWVDTDEGSSFWIACDGDGVRCLTMMVRDEWGGGRVLLLPNGYVAKPLNNEEEIGLRALIGRFQGSVRLETPHSRIFDLADPGNLNPGDPWSGPKTTGLECAIQYDGSLQCKWYHPTEWGSESTIEMLRGPDSELATGFRAARPGAGGGRVRITANGHVITNRREGDENWTTLYVGCIDSSNWGDWDRWIEGEPT